MVNRALLAVVILLAAPRIADACSCPATPPCQTFWIADAVFTGLVTAVTHPSDARPTQTHTETAFVVERGFKGERDQIVIRGDARNELNSCTFKFAVGQRYIVYAARNADGGLYVGKCSGTKLLENAGADLDYAERLPPPGSGGRIYGKVIRLERNRLNPSYSGDKPAAGLTVTLRDSKGEQLEVQTTHEGVFEVTGLKPDKYSISVALPPRVRAYHSDLSLDVRDRQCVPFYMEYETNGRVAGRVVDADGRPVREARVWVFPTQYTNKIDFPNASLGMTSTDALGRYEIGPLPPGEYHAGVNVEWPPTLKSPYAPTFYPGVLTRAEAETIVVEEGKLRSGIDLMLPRKLVPVTISGTVTTADGTPVAGVSVFLASENSRTISDVSGTFTLTGLSGLSHRILASLWVAGVFHGSAIVDVALTEEPVTNVMLVLKKP